MQIRLNSSLSSGTVESCPSFKLKLESSEKKTEQCN